MFAHRHCCRYARFDEVSKYLCSRGATLNLDEFEGGIRMCKVCKIFHANVFFVPVDEIVRSFCSRQHSQTMSLKLDVSLRTKLTLPQQTTMAAQDWSVFSISLDFCHVDSCPHNSVQHLASSEGHLDVVTLLLDSKADVLFRFFSVSSKFS